MGGLGSGRRWQSGKDITDDYRSLDARRWQRDGLLTPGQAFGWHWSRGGEKVASIDVRTEPGHLILSYRHRNNGEEWKSKEYPVELDWTPCTYGGHRAWFRCPAQGCGRRVALLYLGSAGVFACRHCYRLAHASQRESSEDRAIRRVNKIRLRLGWEAGILNREGGKPKGMHWRTYWRMKTRHDELALSALVGMQERFSLITDRAESLLLKYKER